MSDPDTLWHDSAAEPPVGAALGADLSVDLAVIGGGFTGCAAALEAAGQGASVCVLEAQDVGHGGSGRNVGLVNAGLWLAPDVIAAQMGAAAAERLNDLLAGAPGRVFDLIERHAIDCAPVRKGTLYCAHAPAAVAALHDRARQGNRMGAPLRVLDAAETARRTGAAGLHGALFDPRAGTVQPLAYCRGLARAAQMRGARIHPRSAVTRLVRDGTGWLLTANGHEVRAARVLLATNAYHDGLRCPVTPRFVPVAYSQFATDPLPDALLARILPGGEGCWDTALIMSSFRLDAQGRMIVGGLGDMAGPGGALHRGWARRKLAALYPALADMPFQHAWSGRIAMTRDHVPKIVSLGPGGLSCFGYSGRGIGPGTVFGTLAARALLGGDMAVLPVSPDRTHSEPFARARQVVYEFGAAAIHGLSGRLR
ncbi:FAD-binding oxidoreductase [Maribius pontilimi]|uniref:FAD-binding oxidoreductase n=1 Tax=Palleronia pontilimi TaxID=1964209 RepID=A0A934IBT4_9RHOB|nr:FAD-dependent oxidoreductase [Palleronia pontilimi]MBJ3764243.1 FAD-binding oxidoreductase [Palleronia pontilimi]